MRKIGDKYFIGRKHITIPVSATPNPGDGAGAGRKSTGTDIWKIIVHGATNTLYLDGYSVGQWNSSARLVDRSDLRIGLGVFDTYAAFAYVRGAQLEAGDGP